MTRSIILGNVVFTIDITVTHIDIYGNAHIARKPEVCAIAVARHSVIVVFCQDEFLWSMLGQVPSLK